MQSFIPSASKLGILRVRSMMHARTPTRRQIGARIFIFMYPTCACIQCTCMYTNVYPYIHPYTYIHTYIHTYRYVYIHTHTYIRVRIHIHTYTHIHTYIHTYIRIHTCTHIHTFVYNVFSKVANKSHSYLILSHVLY